MTTDDRTRDPLNLGPRLREQDRVLRQPSSPSSSPGPSGSSPSPDPSSSRPSSSQRSLRSWFRRRRRRALLWEAKVGRWVYRRLPVLQELPATQLPLEVEVLALRVLVTGLLIILVLESVLLVLAVQATLPSP